MKLNVSAKRLEDALYALELIGANMSLSDDEKEKALSDQYEYIVLETAREVLAIGEIVRRMVL